MLKSKTVFILGAGASSEVGFPLGFKLREIISNKLNFKTNRTGGFAYGDQNLFERINRRFRQNFGEYIDVCRQISIGILLSDSIDDFIYTHRHDSRIAMCGKLAIAFSIIEAEKKSKIYVDYSNIKNTINFQALGDNWYAKFYSLITKGVAKSDLENIFSNITVINFNYDRSLEHFLVHALSNNYLIGKDKAIDLVKNLTIFRPYGSIDKNVQFGYEYLPDLDNIVTNLKTYTEDVDDSKKLKLARNSIEECKNIIFIGMAYHMNNMKLLKNNCDMRLKTIFATRKGISDFDTQVIKKRIIEMSGDIFIHEEAMLSGKNRIHDGVNIYFSQECRDLFDDYRLSLSEL